MHVYEARPRSDKHGVDLIAVLFFKLGTPNRAMPNFSQCNSFSLMLRDERLL
jgi:hypothetical protein